MHTSGARAIEAGTPEFSFHGFGALGLVHSSDQQAGFTSSFFKRDGAGHSDGWSEDVDGLLGAQATANLASQLVAVVPGMKHIGTTLIGLA